MKWTPTCRKQCPTPHEHSDPRKHRADAPGAYHRHAAATSGGIGKYTLCDKVLGAGATARVCKATCTATGIEYAIKILAARPHVVPNEVAAMRRAARHGHPNICSFREHWRQGGKDYMVLEYCSGGELFSALETAGSLPEPEAQHLSRGLVAGVRFMHSRGVAHRDLKLENLLLACPTGSPGGSQLKICDFGLACVYDRHPDGIGFSRPPLRARCGTRSYTAPEMLSGGEYDGFAADVWSMGVCIFAMVAGFFPLDEARISDWRFCKLAAAQAEGGSSCHSIFSMYHRPCPFSADLMILLDGMLTISPSRRFTLDAVRASDWLRPVGAAILAGGGYQWAVPGMIPRGGSWTSTATSGDSDRGGDEILSDESDGSYGTCHVAGDSIGEDAGHGVGDMADVEAGDDAGDETGGDEAGDDAGEGRWKCMDSGDLPCGKGRETHSGPSWIQASATV